MTQRASLDRLKVFANEVREAGGGNPLDALMPAVPIDSKQCLIARNLNFNCAVSCVGVDTVCEKLPGYSSEDGKCEVWAMRVKDIETGKNIGTRLNLAWYLGEEEGTEEWNGDADDYEKIPVVVILLPNDIGQVANDFDEAARVIKHARTDGREGEFNLPDQYAEFLPYIEASYLEVHNIGTVVDGKLIL